MDGFPFECYVQRTRKLEPPIIKAENSMII